MGSSPLPTMIIKPIPSKPGQSRHHIRVKETRKYYTIDSHVDRYDPEKDQLGHLTDIINPPPHHKIKVEKRISLIRALKSQETHKARIVHHLTNVEDDPSRHLI